MQAAAAAAGAGAAPLLSLPPPLYSWLQPLDSVSVGWLGGVPVIDVSTALHCIANLSLPQIHVSWTEAVLPLPSLMRLWPLPLV